MEPSQGTPASLHLAHLTQPWSPKFSLQNGFDIFFDPFSNCLIFFKEGYFVVWDHFDRLMASTQPQHLGKTPFTLNLATI